MARASVNLKLKTAEGGPLCERNLVVNFKTEDGRDWRTATIPNFPGAAVIDFELPGSMQPMFVEVVPHRFRSEQVVIHPMEGTVVPAQMTLLRLRGAWSPKFVALSHLSSPRFDSFNSVVRASHEVDLKVGAKIGDLSAAYDSLSSPAALLAKMALLNLYSVLTDSNDPLSGQPAQPWFSYVKEIVRLDQERFIALVDAELFENVNSILGDMDRWGPEGYFPEASTCFHSGNIPDRFMSEDCQTISVKKKYGIGNVQLTLSSIRKDDIAYHILDCDMDEHANIVLHAGDMGEHEFTGGTAPIEVHDLIAEQLAAQEHDGLMRTDLGYELM
jgi:hypothetical protein